MQSLIHLQRLTVVCGMATRIDVSRSSGKLIGSVELYPRKVLIQLCDGLLWGRKWGAELKSKKGHGDAGWKREMLLRTC